MGFMDRFRRDSGPSAEGPRDEELRALSVEQARHFSALARQVLAELGSEATISDGALWLAGGQTYGLHNLSVQAAATPFRDWDALVRDHLSTMLAIDESPPSGPPLPEQVFLKLRNRFDLDLTENPLGYPAREVFPDILALVAVDHPTHVAEVLGELDQVGGDLARASELGLRNLGALPPPDMHEMVGDETEPGSAVHLFVSDDFFGASRVLVLDQLLRDALGRAVGEHGVFVIVPNRHILGVHLPTTATGTLTALSMLVGIAREQSSAEAGPISPHVYHLDRAGHGAQVSFTEPDGSPAIRATGQVEDAFRSLGIIE